MGDKTGIEWTDATWNPIRGCSRVSEGCRNCYAETVAGRFSKPGLPYAGLIAKGGQWNGKVRLLPEMLAQPYRWTKPRRIFVNSMSDLFHENVPFEFIASVFFVMGVTTRHTYQILTKRPERMLAFFDWLGEDYRYDDERIMDNWPKGLEWTPAHGGRGGYDNCGPVWPYQNVWLGVSVEDQATADERIPLLLKAPAAVRWVSAEPLLGPVGIWPFLAGYTGRLDWVVVGGESGAKARPMHPDWARSLLHQCVLAGVPILFKQWGEWAPSDACVATTGDGMHELVAQGKYCVVGFDGSTDTDASRCAPPSMPMYRAGKRSTDRLLDGVLHDGYPESGVARG